MKRYETRKSKRRDFYFPGLGLRSVRENKFPTLFTARSRHLVGVACVAMPTIALGVRAGALTRTLGTMVGNASQATTTKRRERAVKSVGNLFSRTDLRPSPGK